ncbi:MAG: acetoacetate--CoA ligase [Rhodobacteraceae bacterium]|nr:acetoacetate--CoA ligase [Paracoccaceae bacterium]
MTQGRDILWTPSVGRYQASTMAAFERYLSKKHDLAFSDYNDMWRWSISDLNSFWGAIADFFELRFFEQPQKILNKRAMPGAEWFVGAKVNYADQLLSKTDRLAEQVAFVSNSETFGRKELTWNNLKHSVASVAENFKKMGVTKGDRVVAILPNTEVALIGLLATASLGAVWSLCAPDMGHVAILDRFKQIKPKLMIAQNGYIHAGKTIDRSDLLRTIKHGLESLDALITIPVIEHGYEGTYTWSDLLNANADFDPVPVPFDHPLWVVYSSGTTGNPKPIVHGHGGILLESMKQSLHHDLTEKDRFCWLTSSGWIMWNAQWTALGQGARVVAFDGAPNYPDMGRVWEVIAEEGVTYFGAGAAFFEGCIKANVAPQECFDLSALRSMGSTGSPLSGDAYDWIYQKVKSDLWLAPISGGTDLSGAFVLGHPGMPVRKGEMQCRALGNAVRAFDEDGRDLIGQVGELVCTEPLPSMPLYFWGDKDGSRLYESYFDTYRGVWRHGDWIEITQDGGSVIYGRSDATINRKGLRMGSSEIYQAVEGLSEIRDSLVVDLEFLGRDSFMPLFVVLMPGCVLDETLRKRINEAIKSQVSPRFLPDEIVEIQEVPRTLSGKKLEVPVKKLLLGSAAEKVVNRDSMSNPNSFDFFIDYALHKTKKDHI